MLDKKKIDRYLKKEKVLPFHGLSMGGQLNIVRGYVAFFNKTGEPATYRDIAPLINVSPSTITKCIDFWKFLGMLKPHGRGRYVPTETAIVFDKLMEAKERSEAWKLIKKQLKKTWVAEHLGMAFKLKEQMNEAELVKSLRSVFEIEKGDKHVIKSLDNLVKLLELAQIIRKDEKMFFGKKFFLSLKSEKVEELKIPEDRDMIQIIVDKERYAVDMIDLKELVKQRGRRLNSKEHILD